MNFVVLIEEIQYIILTQLIKMANRRSFDKMIKCKYFFKSNLLNHKKNKKNKKKLSYTKKTNYILKALSRKMLSFCKKAWFSL